MERFTTDCTGLQKKLRVIFKVKGKSNLTNKIKPHLLVSKEIFKNVKIAVFKFHITIEIFKSPNKMMELASNGQNHKGGVHFLNKYEAFFG